ncbi:MAG: carbamoyltransferase C-terminal domain-containing protein [Candidatus Omnitrophota bacterium]|nr:carbamoyltransferase C-terminal domain-containing protein [Candidatus Omnitrophota bacterium]
MAFNYHDSSVSFAIDNKVVLVLEAERVFREKKKACTQEEMEYLTRYGLNLLGKHVKDVGYWSMTTFNNPHLTNDDIINANEKRIRGPHWKKINLLGSEKDVLITNHHLSHAGTYFCTKYKSAIIISCDGGGDIDPVTNNNECVAVFKGCGDKILKQHLPLQGFITGKTYGVCSAFIFGSQLHSKNPPEGKLMALAASGKIRDEYYNFLDKNFEKIEKTDYSEVLKILERSSMRSLQGQATKQTNDARDFAATLHRFFVEKRMENIDFIIKGASSDEEAMILTGGASLNLDLNTRVIEKYPNFKHFVPPCCDDTGQSLGSLCILITQVLNKRPTVDLPYLGEGVEQYDYNSETLEKAVDILLKNGILILHNGKSEVGPRALGNRSFIARPDSLEIKVRLSEKIKRRESYRPVAPVVLEDKVGEYFIGPGQSPYMLYRYKVIASQKEKVAGAVHIDNSARVQTVSKSENKFLYDLIKIFGERTGVYALLNTSLNLQGEPLANKIEESLNIYDRIDGPKGIVYNGHIIKFSESK